VAVGTDVIAFEPGESALSWLVRNVELNGVIDRVEVRREAVGAKSGIVFFTSGLDTMNHIASDGAAVPITMLDMACKTAPSLIKIDVEGFEADVLRGAREILSSPTAQAVIMELNDDAAAEFLKRLGFTCCSYNPFARGLSTRDSATGNGIFVRDVESAQRRLREAPAFSIRGRVI
jgi:FkbM family methyltransferase